MLELEKPDKLSKSIHSCIIIKNFLEQVLTTFFNYPHRTMARNRLNCYFYFCCIRGLNCTSWFIIGWKWKYTGLVLRLFSLVREVFEHYSLHHHPNLNSRTLQDGVYTPEVHHINNWKLFPFSRQIPQQKRLHSKKCQFSNSIDDIQGKDNPRGLHPPMQHLCKVTRIRRKPSDKEHHHNIWGYQYPSPLMQLVVAILYGALNIL